MIHAVLAFALPAAVFAVLLARLDGGLRWSSGSLPIAVGLSIGASSLVWWALLFVPTAASSARRWIDVACWTVAFGAAWRMRSHQAVLPPPPATPHRSSIYIGLGVLLPCGALAIAMFTTSTRVLPHGTWDAWAIWNLRARFLSRGFPELWRDGFSPLLHWSHPDYPLLLPLSIARGWSYAGNETTAVPIAISALFALATVATAALSVARVRGSARGLLAAAAILASPAFVEHAAGQLADVPLSFFMLTSFVLMFHATAARSHHSWWLLAGLSAGFAAWTKNEGVLFLVVFSGACAWWSIRSGGLASWKEVGRVLCGAAPSLAALAVLKWRIAAPDLLIAKQSTAHILENFGDATRIRAAATALGRELWLGGAQRVGVLPILAGYLLLSGGGRRGLKSWKQPGVPGLAAVTMVVMLVGYVTVYVVTPYDFTWHVSTSVERVALHLFPTLVWSVFMAAGPGEKAEESSRASATLGSFEDSQDLRAKTQAT